MTEAIYGLVASGFVLALWDAARRYLEVKLFNDREIQRIIELEHEQRKLRELIENVGSKLNAAQASQATRSPVRGLR
jgi:hypothetical protein